MESNQENNSVLARAVESLNESEELMRYIVRHDPNGIAIFDAQLHYMAVSDRYLATLQVKEAVIIGKHHYAVFPEIAQHWKEVHQRCLAGAIESGEDDLLERPDGSIIHSWWECRPWYKTNGTIGGIITYTKETTDRKKAEKALQESELKYRSFFENSMDAILLTSPDGTTHSANQAACTMFGYSEEELIHLGRQGIDDTTDPRLSILLAERKRIGKAQGEVSFIRKDGTRLTAEISTSIFQNNEGDDRTSMIIRDITERNKGEETLHKLMSAVEQTINTIAMTDRNGTIEYVNPAFELITGYSSDEVLGKTPRILKSGFKGQEYYEAMWKTILAGQVFRGEVVNRKKNGELFFEEKTISPIFDKNGIITHFVGTGVDLSRLKRTEQALFESERLYHSLFENMLNGSAYCKMIYDKEENPQDFVYIAVNKSFERLTGLQDVVGKMISEVLPGFIVSDLGLFEIYGNVASTGQPEIVETYMEALKMWLSIAVYSPQKGYFVAVFDVITERKNAEEVLLQSEEKFRKLINSFPDPVLVVDTQGKIVYCNHIAMKTFDYTIDQMLGCQLETLMPRQYRDHHLALRNKYIIEPASRAMGGGKELFAQRKDGSQFPTEIMLEPVEINNKPFTLAIVRDISDRKMAENELIKAKEKAEESDRLKSAFLANMSHEVRTPLNSIIGFSELLGDPDFEQEQKKEFIDHIVTNGNQLLRIISDIMDISKMESGEITIRKTQVNAQHLITALGEQFSFQAAIKNLELQLILPDMDEETLLVTDADRLNQVFNNLIINALKFTANGQIAIGFHPYNNLIEFFVSDTGIGIAEQFHHKIFERFRQLEDANTRTYGGNGLGLAISKNLVELMGGKIWVESEPGKGSTFYFTIPLGSSDQCSVFSAEC